MMMKRWILTIPSTQGLCNPYWACPPDEDCKIPPIVGWTE